MSQPLHHVVFIAVPPVMVHDLSVAQTVLEEARSAGRSAYRIDVTTPDPGTVATVTGPDLVISRGLDLAEQADTVFVVGGGAQPRVDERLQAVLLAAAGAGRRIIGACTGVLVLARAGLLDGRRATTHWHVLDQLARDFPQIKVEREALYVEDGSVLTSAGAAAIIELCLHLIRTDHGAAAAAAVGSLILAGPVRPADQPQPVPAAANPRPSAERSLGATRAWAQSRLDTPIALAELAAHARVSERTLTRRFHAETGMSPLRWLLLQRIDLARQLLETTDLTMDAIARRSGLGGADSLRRHFTTRLGVPPSAYRARWRPALSLTTASTPVPHTA